MIGQCFKPAQLGASLGARLSGVKHGPIIVLVMARVRRTGESSLINPVISNQVLFRHSLSGGVGSDKIFSLRVPKFACVLVVFAAFLVSMALHIFSSQNSKLEFCDRVTRDTSGFSRVSFAY